MFRVRIYILPAKCSVPGSYQVNESNEIWAVGPRLGLVHMRGRNITSHPIKR